MRVGRSYCRSARAFSGTAIASVFPLGVVKESRGKVSGAQPRPFASRVSPYVCPTSRPFRRAHSPCRLRRHRSGNGASLTLCRRWQHLASLGLGQRFPDMSASHVLSERQVVALCVGALVVLLCLILQPQFLLHVCILVSSCGFLSGAGLRLALARTPLPVGVVKTCCPADKGPVPSLSILVPLYHEAGVVPDLVAALSALQYPRRKLRILLLIESSDYDTRRAVLPFVRSQQVEMLVIPEGHPRTKARACNYALRCVHSDLLVIFDAEDRPEPDQLLKAAAGFRARPDIACLQARLVIDNGAASLISGLFSIDYAVWFFLILQGFHRLRLPMPLGGSSNYFRTRVLRCSGGWDAYNVTEDADLGIRLARLGYQTAMLNSRTYEEAPVSFSVWLRQRTRWMKGYMQTVFVHSRHPLTLMRELRLAGTGCFIFCILGCVLSALSNPVLWGIFIYGLIWVGPQHHIFEIRNFAVMAGGTSLAVNIAIAMRVLFSRERMSVVLQKSYIFLLPFYWTMMSVAAWRALFQLCVSPHIWEKTPHGCSSRIPHGTV